MHSSPQQKRAYCGTSAGRLGGSIFLEKYGTVCLSIVSTMACSVAFLGCLVFLVGGLSPGGGCEKWVFGAFEGFLGTFFGASGLLPISNGPSWRVSSGGVQLGVQHG